MWKNNIVFLNHIAHEVCPGISDMVAIERGEDFIVKFSLIQDVNIWLRM